MLDPLPHLDIVARDTPEPGRGNYLIQRNANVICVVLEGDIVDAVSDGWRAAAQKSLDTQGYPPFGYVDATRAKVAQTLGARMRSAAFMRRTANRLKRIILVAADANVSFVMRTIMRAAGVGNVHLVQPTPALAALEVMREGRDPLAEGVI